MTGTEYRLPSGSELATRFARVPDGGHVIVAQADFGTGIGFLNTWDLWQQSSSHTHSFLHFISIAKSTLTPKELFQHQHLSPHLAGLAKELAEQFPCFPAGTHRLILDHGRVRLTLCFGEFADAWNRLRFKADAWLPEDPAVAAEPASENQHTLPFPERHQHIAVVGAGIAGCLLASNLAARGRRVTLIDRGQSVAAGASGNRQGALYVKLGVDYNDQTELALSSLLFSQRFYRQFTGNGWHPTGLLQLAHNEAEADRQARLLARNRYPDAVFQPVNADQASRIAGIPVPHGGFWFPDSGWLQPDRICQAMAGTPGIEQRLEFTLASVARTEESNRSHWQLTSDHGETLTFDAVVLSAGPATPELIPLQGDYRMKPIRGQITEVPADRLQTPSVVICGPGYINPALNGRALVGATFDLHNASPAPSAKSDRENLQMLADLLPDALPRSAVDGLASVSRNRVAFRCTTHDYQPVAGPMKTPEGETLDGLYLFTGLGSKGLTYSPLLAEYLADLITGQPPCLPANLKKRVDTQRCHRPVDKRR